MWVAFLSGLLHVSSAANPIDAYCDPTRNAFVAAQKHSVEAFDAFDRQVEDQLKAWSLRRSGGKTEHCYDLPTADWVECKTFGQNLFEPLLFTRERKDQATTAFENAKLALLLFLRERREQKPLSSEGVRKAIESMMRRIQEAELKFGAPRNSDSIEYNMEVHLGKIFVTGMILQIDELPEQFFFHLLHELSHLVDPSEYPATLPEEQSPFLEVYNCLRSERSVGAKRGDAVCFEALATKYAHSDSGRSEAFGRLADYIRGNPDVAYISPWTASDENCQQGQLSEAFADWLGTEAYFAWRQGDLDLDSRVSQIISKRCTEWSTEQWIKWSREKNFGSHPIAEDRLGLIFAHPSVRSHSGMDGGTQRYCGRVPRQSV